MATVRDLAAELGLSSREVLERARQLGSHASGDGSIVDPGITERLRAQRHRPPPAPGFSADGSPAREAPTSVLPRPAASGSGGRGDVGSRSGPEGGPERPKRPNGVVAQLTELPLLVLLAFGIAVVIKTFLLQAFFIPSGSMLPTLNVGDRVLVEKLSYRFGDPAPGDVVVFGKSVFGQREVNLPWYLDVRNFMRELLGLPTGSEQDYIKRIVAVGGDAVRYAGTPRHLVVNGRRVSESYLRGGRDRFSPALAAGDCRRLHMASTSDGCRVPPGKVFVMGDNRGDSEDSRVIGPIRETKIVGHAFVIIWPPGDVGGL
jgi:signal peptidase I